MTWLAGGRIIFGRYKGSYTEADLWEISLDSSGSATGKPFRLTNTTGLGVTSLSASSSGKRLAVLFSRQSSSMFVANLSKTGDKLEQPLRLTNDYWNSYPGCWTPDSNGLFYELDRNDQGQAKSSIYKRAVSSDSAEVFLTGSESYIPWTLSSDRQWVLATADRRVPGKGHLLRIPISGGTPETILNLGELGEVHCAIAGSRICLLSERIGEQWVFSLLDPIHGRGEEVTRIDTAGRFLAFGLSPDGRRIAAIETASDYVRVFDLQTKQLQVVHPPPSVSGLDNAAWSADGKRIFLSAETEDGSMLLTMDLNGHMHVLQHSASSWIGRPTPSPDGKRIAYAQMVGESNVTLLEQF